VANRLVSPIGLDALAMLSFGSDVRGRGSPATASPWKIAFLDESVKSLSRLTLSEALKNGRLQDFVAQEEGRGIGLSDQRKFLSMIRKEVLSPRDEQLEDRTLRSPSADGSTGKRTR